MAELNVLEIKKDDGTLVDFSNDAELGEQLLNLVPDNVMRSVLFNTRLDNEPNPTNLGLGRYGVVKTIKRILNVAYVIAFCRWKQLLDDKKEWAGDDEEAIKYFDNSRFTKLFQSALLGEDISVDLQVFSLLELWVDLKKAPSSVSTPFNMIFDSLKTGDEIGLVLQATRDTVKNAVFKKGNLTGKYTKQACNELCYRLLRAFMVFNGATATYPADNRLDDDRDFSITYKITFFKNVVLYPNTVFPKDKAGNRPKLIASEEQLRLLTGEKDVDEPNQLILYMRTETSAFNDKFQQRYNSLDGERQTYVQTEINNDVTRAESLVRDMHETRKFLSFSYKNIREFAMIINDSIKKSASKKRELFRLCQEQYPKIIADVKDCDAPNIYWDNIITLMLLEMGVSDFLERILCDENIFDDVLENIAWRNEGRSNASKMKREYLDRVGELDSGASRNVALYAKKVLRLRIKTVLKAMNFTTDDDDSRNAFLESLSYKYSNICACIDRLSHNTDINVIKQNARELQKIFGDIFMFLQIFYAGLDGYAVKKMSVQSERQSDAVKANDDASGKKYVQTDSDDELNKAFVTAAKAKLEEIQYQSVSQLFDGFCNLCAGYNTFSEEGEFCISDQAKRLKYVITRNYICDAQKLRHFATVDLGDGEETTVFEVLRNLLTYNDREEFPAWLNYLKDVFMFLIYNEDYNCRGLWNTNGQPLQDKDCDPIYPYIVTYYKENTDRDNVKKCSYHVPLPLAGVETEGYIVTLLTDEEYPPQTYYCIPLRYGSSDSWWINPFLISKNTIRDIGYPEAKKKI